jgi:hypothetical protein
MKKEILELKNKAKKTPPGAAQQGSSWTVGFARAGRGDNNVE